MHIICPENIRYNVSPLKLKNQKVRSKFSSKDHDNTKLTSTKINNFYERA